MNRIARLLILLVAVLAASYCGAREPQKIKGPDERYKVDIWWWWRIRMMKAR